MIGGFKTDDALTLFRKTTSFKGLLSLFYFDLFI